MLDRWYYRDMNKLSDAKRAQVVAALVEGKSIRATVRMTGVAKNTIAKFLVELGAACSEYLDKALVNLPCERIQCVEIGSFCYAKEKNVTPEIARILEACDVWPWVPLVAARRLVC